MTIFKTAEHRKRWRFEMAERDDAMTFSNGFFAESKIKMLIRTLVASLKIARKSKSKFDKVEGGGMRVGGLFKLTVNN